MPKVSIVIATYNMGNLIVETIKDCLNQSHKIDEIIIYDDCSTDRTEEIVNKTFEHAENVMYFRGKVNKGVGDAFNIGISLATGNYIMLMCADDLFASRYYVEDAVNTFDANPSIGYITRYYYQYTDNREIPVRAWHCNDPIVLANNPSGLFFRRNILKNCKCSNKMFIETSKLASEAMQSCNYYIMPYDAIAVRVHESTSTQAGYYLKRRVSSPVMDWHSIGGSAILQDYVSLIQIKVNYKLSAVIEEIYNFIKLRPKNLFSPKFIFFSILTIVMPRSILRKIPHIYRKYIGKHITKRIYR